VPKPLSLSSGWLAFLWSYQGILTACAFSGNCARFRPVEIRVFNNNVEKALKIAKKKLAGEGLFRELKRRRFYEKPSLKRKNKEREAQRRRQKWLAKHKSE